MTSKSLKTILKQIHNRINFLVRECLNLIENGYKIVKTFNEKVLFEFDYNYITKWLYGRCIIKDVLYRYYIDSKDDFMIIIECFSRPNVYFLNLSRYVYDLYLVQETNVYEVLIYPLPLNKEIEIRLLKPLPKGEIYIEPYKEYYHESLDFSKFEKLIKVIKELRVLVQEKINKYIEYYFENDLPTRQELSLVLMDYFMPRWRARKIVFFDKTIRDQIIKLRLARTQDEIENEHLDY